MKTKKGFSLIELLIVIGIIAVLGGVMLTQFSSSTESAMAANCLNHMRTLSNSVIADASKNGYYPSAGPYKYITVNVRGGSESKWEQGWIGNDEGGQPVPAYSDDELQKYYAITNGSIWRTTKGAGGAYLCPSHEHYCKNRKIVKPGWSYVMNSYFGWNVENQAASRNMFKRKYGDGYFTFRYTSAPKNRKRALEKVLLFAEMPFADNGVHEKPDFNPAADDANDSILKYKADGDNTKFNRTGNADEYIGFNHKSGQNYSAHVAFADGHCAKLMLPMDASLDNIIELTTWLCTGREYTFDGREYQEVVE